MKAMDHTTAIQESAAERYVLDELDDTERSAFEEHFFVCQECAHSIRTLSQFVEAAPEALKHDKGAVGCVSAPPRQRYRQWAALPLAAALALLIGGTVYQTLVIIPDLRQQLAAIRQLQAGSWHFLAVARGDPVRIRIPATQQAIGLTLSRGGNEGAARYRVEIEDGSGHTLRSSMVVAPAPGEELQLLLPVAGLSDGRYTVKVSPFAPQAGQSNAAEPGRYPFTLIREEI